MWLIVLAAMVFAMVVIGGLTRLTHSGLSMVEWQPLTGWFPPFSEAEWQRVFAAYQRFPEYQLKNQGMTLDEFKGIFWLEYFHRLWGRLLGVVFIVPFLFFLARGWIDRKLAPKLLGIAVLGGLQGVLGWYMVKSGLIDRPDVSHYRLTAHLLLAMAIYAAIVWLAMLLLSPEPHPQPTRLSPWAKVITGLIFITALWGGLVAGLDAGFAYNTFPLMDGAWFPPELLAMQPLWTNFFENIAGVQFAHRLLAVTTFLAITGFWIATLTRPVAPRARVAASVLMAAGVLQVALGIATLVQFVPVPLAAAHQAGAVVLLTAALWSAFTVRRPRGRTAFIEAAALG